MASRSQQAIHGIFGLPVHLKVLLNKIPQIFKFLNQILTEEKVTPWVPGRQHDCDNEPTARGSGAKAPFFIPLFKFSTFQVLVLSSCPFLLSVPSVAELCSHQPNAEWGCTTNTTPCTPLLTNLQLICTSVVPLSPPATARWGLEGYDLTLLKYIKKILMLARWEDTVKIYIKSSWCFKRLELKQPLVFSLSVI